MIRKKLFAFCLGNGFLGCVLVWAFYAFTPFGEEIWPRASGELYAASPPQVKAMFYLVFWIVFGILGASIFAVSEGWTPLGFYVLGGLLMHVQAIMTATVFQHSVAALGVFVGVIIVVIVLRDEHPGS